ncbi:MAG: exodeoxyribonuclease III [Gammaproteobacteria bacterium]|nr:exodeoxyribonuclease III [Gammaproteobacteria bacterium]
MKIASWNVNSLKVRLEHVLDWLRSAQPDVLALQETKLTDEAFPATAIEAAGYHVVYAGQKTYNGVALLSREPPAGVVTDIEDLDDPSRRIIAATIDDVRVLNLYVVNGQEVGSDKYTHKLHWLDKVHNHVARELEQHPKLVVLGDFNIAPDDRDVHDPEAWHEKILCSSAERAALQRLLDLGLSDTFRLFEQPESSFSWWDYRAAAFRRNLGLRIDLVLASQALAERCKASYIDKAPRKLERPSDHAPVVAEFDS